MQLSFWRHVQKHSYDDLHGHAQQIGFVEFHAGPLVAVVKKGVDVLRLQPVMDSPSILMTFSSRADRASTATSKGAMY